MYTTTRTHRSAETEFGNEFKIKDMCNNVVFVTNQDVSSWMSGILKIPAEKEAVMRLSEAFVALYDALIEEPEANVRLFCEFDYEYVLSKLNFEILMVNKDQILIPFIKFVISLLAAAEQLEISDEAIPYIVDIADNCLKYEELVAWGFLINILLFTQRLYNNKQRNNFLLTKFCSNSANADPFISSSFNLWQILVSAPLKISELVDEILVMVSLSNRLKALNHVIYSAILHVFEKNVIELESIYLLIDQAFTFDSISSLYLFRALSNSDISKDVNIYISSLASEALKTSLSPDHLLILPYFIRFVTKLQKTERVVFNDSSSALKSLILQADWTNPVFASVIRAIHRHESYTAEHLSIYQKYKDYLLTILSKSRSTSLFLAIRTVPIYADTAFPDFSEDLARLVVTSCDHDTIQCIVDAIPDDLPMKIAELNKQKRKPGPLLKCTRENHTLALQKDELDKQVQSLRSSLLETNDNLVYERTRADSLSEQLARKKELCEEYEYSEKVMRDKLQEQESKTTEMKEVITLYKEHLNRLESARDQLENKLNAAEQRESQHLQKIEYLNRELTTLRSTIMHKEDLIREKEDLLNAMNIKSSEAQSRAESYEKQAEAEEARKNHLLTELSQATQINQSLRSSIEALEKKISTMDKENQSLASDLAKQTKRVTRKSEEVQKLRESCMSLSNEVRRWKSVAEFTSKIKT